MSYTVRDLLSLSLNDAGVVGVGQDALAEDMDKAVRRFNDLLSEWNVKRWLVYALKTVYLTSTGSQTYTIGPGGSFEETVRPDKIESAFFRQLIPSPGSNPPDYPLKIITSREDYNTIALKNLSTFGEWLYYDGDFPLGNLYPWPVLTANIYQLHISIKKRLEAITVDSDLELSFPPEYFRALRLNVCVELRDAYDLPPKPMQVQLAKNSLATIRGANAQISSLKMPAALVRPGYYNIYSDRSN